MSDPVRPPELSELETFVLAIEEGSIARAATRLRISSPAAAKRIRQLEALAHEPLLNRGRRGVSATEAGQRLYPIARDLVTRRGEAIAALSGRSPSDPLRIAGVYQLLGRTPLPPREEVVRDTEVLLAAIFHATREGVLLTRAEDGLIYEVNDAAARMLGYSHGELHGRHVSDIDLWAEPERGNALVRAAVATRSPQQEELVVRSRTGRSHVVLARFEAIQLHGVSYMLLTIREAEGASRPSSASPESAPPGAPPARDHPGAPAVPAAELAERYLDALRRGEPELAISVAEELFERGGGLAAVHCDLIDPAMKTIGDLWARNVITVAEEHVATEISQRVAARLFWRSVNGAPRDRGRLMMAAVQGEHHVLGLRLAADVLECAGFDVLYLGADLPHYALLHACRTYRPDVVGLTVTMPLNLPAVAQAVAELCRLERPPRVIVGGRVAETAIANGVPASLARRSDELIQVVERVLTSNDQVAEPA